MDLISEVRGAFASDAVWLTDFEPVSGFNAAKALGPKLAPGARDSNGQEVVKQEFFNNAYGTSSLNDIRPDATAPAARRPGPAQAASATANAIRIQGFWRENPKSQNLVSELLKNLREKSTGFRFTVKDAKGADVALSDEQIMAITVEGEPGDLGLPFQITLPLAREISIK
jgi:hypothetical protein